ASVQRRRFEKYFPDRLPPDHPVHFHADVIGHLHDTEPALAAGSEQGQFTFLRHSHGDLAGRRLKVRRWAGNLQAQSLRALPKKYQATCAGIKDEPGGFAVHPCVQPNPFVAAACNRPLAQRDNDQQSYHATSIGRGCTPLQTTRRRRDHSSSNFRLSSASSSLSARVASAPSAWTTSLLPGPAASIIRPMMLLPLIRSPSFSTKTSHSKRLAVLTNIAAGRAWMPSLFEMTTSLVRKSPSGSFFALMG